MYLRVSFILFFIFVAADSSAQFWKKKKKAENEAALRQPTSLNPNSSAKEKVYAPKASQKASKGPTYGLEQQYYERMAKLEKVRKKEERIMQKPQYSNPLYFGHKHPPKKRKPSRMKFCKVCGIRH